MIPVLAFSIKNTAPFDLSYGFNASIPLESSINFNIANLKTSSTTGFDNLALTPLPFRSTTGTKFPDLEFSVTLRPRLFFGIEVLGGALVKAGAEAFIDLPKLNVAINSQPDTENGQSVAAEPANPVVPASSPTNQALNVLKRQVAVGGKQLTHITSSLEIDAVVALDSNLPFGIGQEPFAEHTFFDKVVPLPTLCLADDDEVASTQGLVTIQKSIASGTTVDTTSPTTLAAVPPVAGYGYVSEADTVVKVASTPTTTGCSTATATSAIETSTTVGTAKKKIVSDSTMNTIAATTLLATATTVTEDNYTYISTANTDIRLMSTISTICTAAAESALDNATTNAILGAKVASNNMMIFISTSTRLTSTASAGTGYGYASEVSNDIKVAATTTGFTLTTTAAMYKHMEDPSTNVKVVTATVIPLEASPMVAPAAGVAAGKEINYEDVGKVYEYDVGNVDVKVYGKRDLEKQSLKLGLGS
ncbi:MAG: hypothetical protein Q9166_002661 [cf. Caloplaca sp. 2 TL-2023]